MNWEDAAQSFESSLMILRKDKNGWVIGFSVHPAEVPEALLSAPLGTRFQQVLFQIGDDETPVPIKEVDEEGRKSVQTAAMICRNADFQEWIQTQYWDPTDPEDEERMEKTPSEEGARNILCELLNIASRSELRSNLKARSELEELLNHFREFETQDLVSID